MANRFCVEALQNVPMVRQGDDLPDLIINALANSGQVLEDGDILVLAQKIVSKSEGRLVDLRTITPGQRAIDIAANVGKDPRLVEVILSESRSIVRQAPGVLITEHRLGHIMANAGIDASNVAPDTGPDSVDDLVLLLPQDPDATCAQLRNTLESHFNARIGVIMNDSFGRPWRNGTTGVAIGAAGLPSLWDRRGEKDLFGRVLKVSQQAIADELAAAASLLQGQGAEGQPVILVRGLDLTDLPTGPAKELLRPKAQDLFR